MSNSAFQLPHKPNYVKSKYETKLEDYKTWIDLMFDAVEKERKFGPFTLELSDVETAILIGIWVYGIGLILATLLDLRQPYSSSGAIYVGIFGIAWVCFSIRYASKHIHKAFEDFRLCVIISDDRYARQLHYWANLLADHKGNLFDGLLAAIIAIVFAFLALNFSNQFIAMGIKAFRPSIFAPGWFAPGYNWNSLVVFSYFAITIGLPLGTGRRLLRLNRDFLKYIQTLTLIPEPDIARVHIRRLNNLFIFTAFTWFVGVALFGIVFLDTIDVVSLSILGFLSTYGIRLVLASQITFRTLLSDAHDRKVEYLTRYYLKEVGLTNIYSSHAALDAVVESASVEKIIADMRQPSLRVLNFFNILLVIVGQLFALLSPAIFDVILSRIVPPPLP